MPSVAVRKWLMTSPRPCHWLHRFSSARGVYVQHLGHPKAEIVGETLFRIGGFDIDQGVFEGCCRCPGHGFGYQRGLGECAATH